MSCSISAHLSLVRGTPAPSRASSAAAMTLSSPSSPISPSCTARAAAPTYVRKNTTGRPLMSLGAGTDGPAASLTTCRNTALTTSGYSRSIVSPASWSSSPVSPTHTYCMIRPVGSCWTSCSKLLNLRSPFLSWMIHSATLPYRTGPRPHPSTPASSPAERNATASLESSLSSSAALNSSARAVNIDTLGGSILGRYTSSSSLRRETSDSLICSTGCSDSSR
mmetsp:Transcript_30276/g.88562  ORF Transcript_30276/g.88562 Transcript_30276/m.88562 type:complete len:222 (-) Transcript_30276:445-1110(-)